MNIEPVCKKAVLDNGITLVAEIHPNVRSVSLGVWVKVGSSLETPSVNGLSHFIEHMVFKGTEKRSPLEIATVLECLGGDLNAFTDRETTCYHATVLKEHVDIALDVLSDLVMRPTFEKVQLDRERKVLLQELSMIEESPDDWINDLFFSTVWKGHPLGQTVIGSKKTITTITRNQLLDFFHQHYRPDNMVISIAGNVDFDRVKSLCEDFFRFKSKQKMLPLRPPPTKFHSRRKSLTTNTDQSHLLVGFEAMGFKSVFRFDALILSFFLGGGMSSRLFQEIREKAALAYSVDCDYIPFTETGVFTIYAAMAPRSVKPCLEILSREIDRLKKEPLTDRQLGVVKGQLKGTILLCADQMETRQESMGRNEVVFGRYVPVEEVISEIERVSAERVLNLAQTIFQPAKQTIVTLGRSKPRVSSLTVV